MYFGIRRHTTFLLIAWCVALLVGIFIVLHEVSLNILVCYLMPNTFHAYILYIRFCLVALYDISTLKCYLMPNPPYSYILYIWFCLVALYDIPTLESYLMPNPLYTNISNT